MTEVVGPVVVEIDRADWTMEWREAIGASAVMVDGYDAGLILQDNGTVE
jgi:hypothetical protein